MLVLHGKKDFADMRKSGTLQWGVYPGLFRWNLNAITYIPLRGRRRDLTIGEGCMMMEAGRYLKILC